ncbi:uncharacterized protein FTOL_10923 [Fusarium torulosum]|uniref:DUF7587 domain-containing protein n=1 Tax=Fusarium torulosum TaxID=33205 RepID=A0AAE8MHB0_9HYPO|nr:uncharacterized protein FTOL_10923 [Fusarium torulosum]
MPSTNNTRQSITDAMDALRVADDYSTNQSQQPTLAEAVANLHKAVVSLRPHANQLPTLSADRNTGHKADPSDLLSLRNTFACIVELSDSAVASIDRWLVQSIVSLGGDHDQDISNLLHYFDEAMEQIVATKLDEKDEDIPISVSDIAMECLKETAPFGKLDHKHYIASHEYEDPDWLYHSDSTRNGILYENFTLSERMMYNSARSRHIQAKWRSFWLQVVRTLPREPTLFDLPDNTDGSWTYADLPRYLFRAYDAKSPGINTRSVIASCQSAVGSPAHSSLDVLSLPPQKAAESLWKHLTKNRPAYDNTDNFVSWSSSFMFVIQHAIWRSEVRQMPASDLQICVVDTRDFPHGQFARDMWLLRKYRDLMVDRPEEAFFDFRLGRPEHDNGQFLSQGAINLGNKACVFSLQDLMSSGLSSLYPQFKGDPYDGGKSIDRVLNLRSIFSHEARLDEGDLMQAYDIARKLFKKFDVMDMTLLLLSFQNRKITWEVPDRHAWAGEGNAEPADVHRYMRWIGIWEACFEGSTHSEFFEGFFM